METGAAGSCASVQAEWSDKLSRLLQPECSEAAGGPADPSIFADFHSVGPLVPQSGGLQHLLGERRSNAPLPSPIRGHHNPIFHWDKAPMDVDSGRFLGVDTCASTEEGQGALFPTLWLLLGSGAA